MADSSVSSLGTPLSGDQKSIIEADNRLRRSGEPILNLINRHGPLEMPVIWFKTNRDNLSDLTPNIEKTTSVLLRAALNPGDDSPPEVECMKGLIKVGQTLEQRRSKRIFQSTISAENEKEATRKRQEEEQLAHGTRLKEWRAEIVARPVKRTRFAYSTGRI